MMSNNERTKITADDLLVRRVKQRSEAYRRFNQTLVDEGIISYIYDNAKASSISSSVRRLFGGIYDRYGPQPVGGRDTLDANIQGAADEMWRKLLATGVCHSEEDAREVMSDIMSRAKHFVTTPIITDKLKQQEAKERGLWQARAEQEGIALPTGDDFHAQAFLDRHVRVVDSGAVHFADKASQLWNELNEETYSATAFSATQNAIYGQNYTANQAIGVAAGWLRRVFEEELGPVTGQGKEAARRTVTEDCPALFAAEYPSLFGTLPDNIVSPNHRSTIETEMIRSMKDSKALSPAVAFVFLDAQKHAAREASIQVFGMLARHELRPSDPQFRKKTEEIVKQHLKPLDTFIALIRDHYHVLTRHDDEMLKHYASRIYVTTNEFLSRHTRRDVGRSL